MASEKESTLILKIKEVGSAILDKMVITLEDLGNIAGKTAEFLKKIPETFMELIAEGEKVKKVNASFEALARSAGLSADAIKEGLVGSAKGLIDDTDLIMAANKGIVTLGQNASKMPEIMDLARKATSIFGGSVVDNFEAMNQSIASGNTRALKHLGIIIDSEQAMNKYAESMGTTASRLNETGRAHAILNAVLEQGNEKFSSIKAQTDSVSASNQRLKVAYSQLYEAVAVATEKAFGASTAQNISNWTEKVKYATNWITYLSGSTTDKAAAKIEILSSNLVGYEAQLKQMQITTVEGDLVGMKMMEAQKKRIADTRAELDMLRQEKMKAASAEEQANRNSVEGQQKKSTAELEIVRKTTFEKAMLVNKGIEQENSMIGANHERRLSNEIKVLDAKIAAEENQTMKLQLVYQQRALLEQQQEELRFNEKNAREVESQTYLNALQTADYEGQMSATINFLEKKIQQESDAQYRLTLIKQKAAAANELAAYQADKRETENKKKALDEREANQRSSFATIATLSSSNNQTLAAIGKAAGITQIAIDTPIAISKALAAFPPPFNFAAAGLVATAMAAQASRIAGVQLAEGGIVKARPGGIQATIGEGGRDEAVIPLENGRIPGTGAGNITIVVNGGLLGDQSSARELAVALDKELLKLRRSNESVSFDGGIT